jgi:hypothetical protein
MFLCWFAICRWPMCHCSERAIYFVEHFNEGDQVIGCLRELVEFRVFPFPFLSGR